MLLLNQFREKKILLLEKLKKQVQAQEKLSIIMNL
jgi:hypothetical protein